MEQPYKGRAKFIQTENDFTVVIPAKRNWFVILFITFWLGAWGFGEYTAGTRIISMITQGSLSDGGLFMIFWICGWTVGGFMVSRALWWMIAGKEIITCYNSEMQVHRKGDFLNRPKTYLLSEITQMSACESSSSNYYSRVGQYELFFPGTSGAIKFDYGLKTIKIGSGLDEAEGRYIIEVLKGKSYLPEHC